MAVRVPVVVPRIEQAVAVSVIDVYLAVTIGVLAEIEPTVVV